MDDGVCEVSDDGRHDWALTTLLPLNSGGMAQVDECSWCGAQAYTPSAADDPRRPPL